MTPPDNRPILPENPEFTHRFPFAVDAGSQKTSCPSNLCHESPKKADPFAPHPFFSDLAIQHHLIASTGFSAHKPVIAQVSPFLRAENANLIVPPPDSQNAVAPKASMPPEQAKIFSEKGNEFLKQAQKPGLNIEERLNHFHTALFNFQMLGNASACKLILQEMLGLYEKNGNEFGKTYIRAQLAFLQGNEKGFSEAILAYEQLDAALKNGISGLSSVQVDALRGDLKNKLFIAYVSRGQLFSSEGNFQKATLDFEKALRLNPNKLTFQLYAQAAYRSGLFDFADHDRQIESLRFQRNFLPQEFGSQPCLSHHQAPPSDFKIRQHQEKLRAHQEKVDANISAIQIQSGKNQETFREMMSLAYPSSNSAERYEKDLATAQFLEQFGRRAEASLAYVQIMKEREGSKEPAEVLRYATAANHLAGYALQDKSNCGAREHAGQAIQALQAISESAETKFLISQAKFIQAEAYLNNGNIESGRKVLEALKSSTPSGEKGSLQDQLLGRIYVRLAQVYYSKKETFYLGDQLAEKIKTKFKGESEIVGDTFFAKALSRVGTGHALEAVDILREEVQKPYPQSSAARAIASDGRFKNFLTTQVNEKGETQVLLKASSEINEADWGEAFKVAVAKSGEGSTERKVTAAAAGGAGVLAALAFAPEPVATKVAAGLVAVGMGVGLLWERFVSAGEHSDEIMDAYRSGISNISDSQNTMNMLLLGTDVAMLLTAGMAGSVAKAFVREGLAVTAEEMTAKWVMSAGFKVAGDDAAVWVGRSILFAAEHSASGLTSYTAYQMQRSLVLSEKFVWDPTIALEWIAMGSLIDGASRLPFLGTAVAELPAFQRGPLKNIIVNGKVVGQTTTEGLAAKWVVDAGFGLSAYYAWAKPNQSYAEFMTHNLYMMGVLHAGGAVARKVTGGAPEAFISKIDKRANLAFAQARENILKDPPIDGGFGWQAAYAGGGVSGAADFGRSRPFLDHQVYFGELPETTGGGRNPIKFDGQQLSESRKAELKKWLGEKELESLSFKEQEKLVDHLLENERWSFKDLQDLITPEGMSTFLGFGKSVPFGFVSVAQWNSFQKMLLTELTAAGVSIHDPRVKIIVQGSAVKGRDSKQGQPYRWEARQEIEGKFGQASDIDVAIIVDQSLFDQFVQRKIDSMQSLRKNLRWDQSIGQDGVIRKSRQAVVFDKAVKKGKLDPYNLDPALQLAHNNLRNTFQGRGIQLSILSPISPFIPLPEDAMVISAALLAAP